MFSASSQAQGTSTTVVLTIRASDGDGYITFGALTWGDGGVEPAEATPVHCPAYPSPTAAPGPYRPVPSQRTFTFRHSYPAQTSYSIAMTVRSGNSSCRPSRPAPEARSARLTPKFSS